MNSSARRRGLFGALCGLLAGPVFVALGFGPVCAQSVNDWAGKRVVTKTGAKLRIGNIIVDDEKSGNDRLRRTDRCVYRVEQINGPWLWLQDEKSGTAGWVTVESLVPFDQAIDYFTN